MTRITIFMKSVFALLCLCTITLATAQDVKIVKYDQLEQTLESNSNKLRVINFWATWCGPCIKELPHFEKVNTQENVEVILVSLDFIQDEAKVKRFVEKKRLQSQVWLLNEKDYDSYMGKVDNSWSGAIPATLFVTSSGKRHFFEKAFTGEELEEAINQFMD